MVKLVLVLAAAVLGLFAVRTVVTGALEFRRAKRGELVRIECGRQPGWSRDRWQSSIRGDVS